MPRLTDGKTSINFKTKAMNLYVPEIGDKLKLTKDWTFNLHAERRNESLALYFGYYLHSVRIRSYLNSEVWVDESLLPRMRNHDYKVIYPERPTGLYHNPKYSEACREAEQSCPEYVKYYEDVKIHDDKAHEIGKRFIEVTIPAGTTIKVDRIYIRKGLQDYSSLTFYCSDLGSVVIPKRYSSNIKKKAIRFWAKLSDCNTIEFEK